MAALEFSGVVLATIKSFVPTCFWALCDRDIHTLEHSRCPCSYHNPGDELPEQDNWVNVIATNSKGGHASMCEPHIMNSIKEANTSKDT